MSFFDCVEIGTCDFGIQATLPQVRTGLCVEPIKYYLDKIEYGDKPGIKKIQCAISNANGTCSIYYITPDVIERMGFPDWFRGCNSINKYHPTVVRVIEERKLKPYQYISSYIVQKKTLYQLLENEGVKQIYMLKIDTEGHDCIILDKYLDDIQGQNSRLPYVLYFETNILTEEPVIQYTLDRLHSIGFDILKRDDSDAFLRLNLQRLQGRSEFSLPLDNYYIMNFPEGYDQENPGHDNTLESALSFCKERGYAGVTFQNDKYTVRMGPYLLYDNENGHNTLISWVYL